jgi:hypothetical protein
MTCRFDTNKSCQLVSPYIPEAWSNLTHVNSITLVNLGLRGTVPLLIYADMPKLRFLTLAHNQFTAMLTPQPGEFNFLSSIDL